jgi:uncharacterized membrane protein YraQ (UPF0718 family)
MKRFVIVKSQPSVLIPTVLMVVLAIGLLVYGYQKGEDQHIAGLKYAGTLLWSIIPLLISAFIVAGMLNALLPQEAVAKWIGNESGFKGIILGSLAGGLTPGGPFIAMPIAAGLVGSGAAIGPIVAYMTGWSLWAVQRIPIEMGVLGWKITAIRIAATLIMPPLAGVIAHLLFSHVNLGVVK